MQLPKNLPARYTRMNAGHSDPIPVRELMREDPTHSHSYDAGDLDPLKMVRPGMVSWLDADQRRRPVFNIEDTDQIIAASKALSQKNILKSIEKQHGMPLTGRHGEEFKMHKTNVAVEAAAKAAVAADAAKQAAEVAKTNGDQAVAEQAAATAVKAAAKAQESAAAATAVAKEAVAEASEAKAKAKSALGVWEQEYPGLLHAWESDVRLDGWESDVRLDGLGEGKGGMKKILCCMACVAVGAGIGIFLAKKAII